MARYLQIKSGRFTGTGAAVDIKLGFRPVYVKVFSPGAGVVVHLGEAFSALSQDYAYDTFTSAAGVTDVTAIGSNGIKIKPEGFTVGTTYSANGSFQYWIAIG